MFLYIVGALGVYIFIHWFVYPYIRKQLYWLLVRRISKRMIKVKGDQNGNLARLNKRIIKIMKKEKL